MPTQPNQTPALEIPEGTLQGVAKALRHWHEHRPKMYTELYQQGNLLDTAIAAHEATIDDAAEIEQALIREGYDESTAFVTSQQTVRERYVYLPTEEDVPDLMKTESGIYIYQPEQSG